MFRIAIWGIALALNIGLSVIVGSAVFSDAPGWLRLVFGALAAIFAMLAIALMNERRTRPTTALWRAARYLCWLPTAIFALGSLDSGRISGHETLAIIAMAAIGGMTWAGLSRVEAKHA